MAEPLTLMTIHAHPDDEAIGTGGILKRYSIEGIRTVLVLATRGEAGEINGHVQTGKEKKRVVDLRMGELECSCRTLGVHKTYFLEYRDSGMAGTPENTLPGAFGTADVQEAAKRLAGIIRQERPHVITTYNEYGTYGHPDHIAVNRVTMKAFELSGKSDGGQEPELPLWQPLKLYYQAIPLSRIRKMVAFMKERAEQLSVDPESMGTEDKAITTCVDIRDVIDEKFAAIRCHKSQVGENSFFNQFTQSQRRELFGFESFLWVAGRAKPNGQETDLFEGIRN
jgi:LmbE family N-acetylglucosaminyl deacetylase